MSANQILFLIFSGITLGSAVMVVSSRRMMHAALWLVLTLMGVAGLFALLESRFFTVVQVLVYIGAIAILIIFAVMLTQKVMVDTIAQLNHNYWAAFVAAAAFLGGLLWIISRWALSSTITRTVPEGGENLAEFGKALVDPNGYIIPFEMASVLLLAALVGSIYIAVDRKRREK